MEIFSKVMWFLTLFFNGIISSNYWPYIWKNHATTAPQWDCLLSATLWIGTLRWIGAQVMTEVESLCQPYRFCWPSDNGLKFEGFSCVSINDLSWSEYLKILFYIIHTRIHCFETCILQLESMQACMYILLLWIYVCVNILVYIHARMFWPWSFNQYFRRLIGNFSFSEFFSPSRYSQESIRVCFLKRKQS